MIDHDVLERILSGALRTGAEFAEVYAEDKRSTSASLDDGRVEQVTSGRDRGAGIRVVKGDTTGFRPHGGPQRVGPRGGRRGGRGGGESGWRRSAHGGTRRPPGGTR